MNELDRRMVMLWQRDMPSAQDAAFMLSTLQRIERYQLISGLLRLALLMSTALLVAVFYAPGVWGLLEAGFSDVIAMDSLSAVLLSLTLVMIVAAEAGLLRLRI
ncbi:MAG: hypothetical protein QM808_11075 [Steroidobacteraceae bacterium]